MKRHPACSTRVAVVLALVAAATVIVGTPADAAPIPIDEDAASCVPVGDWIRSPTTTHLNGAYLHNAEDAGGLAAAVGCGFEAAEFDVLLRSRAHLFGLLHDPQRLWLGHTQRSGKSLERDVLTPLAARAKANGGHVYPDTSQPFLLVIELKDNATAPRERSMQAYHELVRELEPSKALLSRRSAAGSTERRGAVTVLLTGHEGAPYTAEAEANPYLFLDGSLDGTQTTAANGVLLINKRWQPTDDYTSVKGYVEAAEARHLKLRMWSTPDNRETWNIELAAGVHYIETNQPAALRWFVFHPELHAAPNGGSAPTPDKDEPSDGRRTDDSSSPPSTPGPARGGESTAPKTAVPNPGAPKTAAPTTAPPSGDRSQGSTVPPVSHDAAPCDAGQVSKFGHRAQVCPLWRDNVPVYDSPDRGGAARQIGTLYKGGRANWFVGQSQRSSYSFGPYQNRWWAFTMADNDTWGWVPEVFFKGGENDERDAGLHECGTRGNVCSP